MQPPEFSGEAPRPIEELLLESEERFRLLVGGVKDYAIFMLDTEGYITTWNQGAERIKGVTGEGGRTPIRLMRWSWAEHHCDGHKRVHRGHL
jgi:PAS domain S-box-containing protein